jgi:small-conductance mechanosensitive channel
MTNADEFGAGPDGRVMERFLDAAWLEEQALIVWAWLLENALNTVSAAQLVAIIVAYLAALAAARKIDQWPKSWLAVKGRHQRLRQIVEGLIPLIHPALWLVILGLALTAAQAAGWPSRLLALSANLVSAWVVIRLLTSLIGNSVWMRSLALVIWSVAALNILGMLEQAAKILDEAALQLGEFRLSALSVLTGLFTLVILVWLAQLSSRFLERKIADVSNLTPSIKILLGNMIKIALLTIAVVAALGAVGIDLTAFALFGGALGVGVGFGLQKVVSNFVSGIILLLDRSVKPGDVIVIGETYGSVKTLGARFTAVITRDGAEHLIPNEDLITQRVENWTHSNRLVRLKQPIGISYDTDVRKAIELVLEATADVNRVLAEPAPACLLRGFGDSSVDLELRFWIRDPANGVANVKSEILLIVWDKFHQAGIEIPFPQLDLHLSRKPPSMSVAESEG